MVLLDTHSWVWAIDDAPRLSANAIEAIEAAAKVYISPVSFYEICQKVRLGKWPEMVAHVAQLQDLAAMQNVAVTPFTAEVASRAGLLDWAHRDPFDRMLAATALVAGLGFVSADTAFDELPGLRRIW